MYCKNENDFIRTQGQSNRESDVNNYFFGIERMSELFQYKRN